MKVDERIKELMRLIDLYAEARHVCGDPSYNMATAHSRGVVQRALKEAILGLDEGKNAQ